MFQGELSISYQVKWEDGHESLISPAAGTARMVPMPAQPGDLILIDSAQVGFPPREGQIVAVIERELGSSYWVRWQDGHETLITPAAGTARIVRS